ncbi:DUF6896 domain-containing protein [Actinoplanes sp. CA-131856]
MMGAGRDESPGHVARFVAELRVFSSAVLVELDQIDGLSQIIRAARSGRIPRRDTLPNGIYYQIHGSGCVFIGADGAIVNIDFLPDGRAIFDVTRVEEFVRSLSTAPPPGPDLLAECRSAVAGGLLDEVKDGWFALREPPSRIESA